MSHIYPEIKAELVQLESNIEELVLHFSRKAPEFVKENVLKAIDNLPQESVKEKGKVVEMVPNQRNDMMRYLAAACVVISFIISGVIYQSNNSLSEELASTNKILSDLEYQQGLDREILAHINDTATKKIILHGTSGYPNEVATIYWNIDSKKTYALFADLTPPPADKQFQLWAIVDGKPLDLGVYDAENKFALNSALINAQAFAITLEKKGGAVSPTLEQMVVLGNI